MGLFRVSERHSQTGRRLTGQFCFLMVSHGEGSAPTVVDSSKKVRHLATFCPTQHPTGALRVNRQQNVKKWNMEYNTGKSGEHKLRAVDVQGPWETHYKREDSSTRRALKSLRVCLKAREDSKEGRGNCGNKEPLRDKQRHTRTQVCWYFKKRQLSGNRK